MSLQAAPAATEDILLRQDHEGIATLTLNRPRQYNALSEEMLEALQTALDDISRDDSLRVVILAANGPAFCAGHDLKQMRATPDQGYYQRLFTLCSRLMLTMTTIPQPVIARVHGMATAAGCQLVATCDLAVATTEARFATSGINVGLFCSTPAVALSRNVSRKRAFEMLVTGDFIDAATAQDYGLINHAVAPEDLDKATADLAAKIVAKSPVAVTTGKKMYYHQLNLSMEDAYAYAADIMACNMMADDAGEGIDAFVEKRKPVWRGR